MQPSQLQKTPRSVVFFLSITVLASSLQAGRSGLSAKEEGEVFLRHRMTNTVVQPGNGGSHAPSLLKTLKTRLIGHKNISFGPEPIDIYHREQAHPFILGYGALADDADHSDDQ